nr:DUF4198 domain-containing protein [Thiocapsa imhoffii]
MLLLGSAWGTSAHFQELIPSQDIVSGDTGAQLRFEMRFTHPMDAGPLMSMDPPLAVGVLGPGGRDSLLSSLEAVEVDGQQTFQFDYQIKAPGDHLFYVEPAPYWEPAEGVMIQHYTKVVVDGYGGGDEWDADLGLPVEIQPLTRPYGLWAGNLFRGIVKQEGEPVPFATVEVEWRNDGSVTPPFAAYSTQVVKADAQGVFSYAMPRAGWWGFAALIEGEEPMMNPHGEAVPLELGALIWVYAREMR